MNIALLAPDPLDTLSGGYLYDRRIAAGLSDRGHTLTAIATRGRSPAELARDLALARADAWLEDELGCDDYLALHRHVGAARPPAVSLVHVPSALLGEPRAGEAEYLRTVDAAIFVSDATRRDTERLFDLALPCAIVEPGSDHLAIYPRTAARDGPLRLVAVGTLAPHKGYRELVAAVGRALAQLPPSAIELWVFGAPADPAVAGELSGSRTELGRSLSIELVTRSEPEQLARALASAHALVHAAPYESYCIAAAEALRAGTPVVSWTAGGCRAFLRHDDNALLVAPGDLDGFGDAIGRLARDRDLAQRLSDGARRSATWRLSTWQHATDRIERFLAEQIAGRW